ncbi:MAG: sugar ABC transporter permease [Eubacteriales bacterium]|nr:sugar ABC transporter permease [Eubacteriales bacterium]
MADKNDKKYQELTKGLNPEGAGESKEAVDFRVKNYKKHRRISYAKYGYLFLIPFFVAFIIFQLIPLFQTFYYSFFRYERNGIDMIGPIFKGWRNYKLLFTGGEMWKYLGNTLIIWIVGFLPQMVVSLLLAIWFTDSRLKLHGTKFFQTVTYMPNLVMAAAFGYMFNMFFSQGGPVNQILMSCHWIDSPYLFKDSVWWVRCIIAFINFLMWFGNTSILLMSGIMGIDESVFESSRLDGANSHTVFWKITFPLLTPIFVYFVITSMIGGIQLFDAAQVFTLSNGGPDKTSMTIMMYLYTLITSSQNYGLAGALSVLLFLITGILSLIVFKTMVPNNNPIRSERRAQKARLRYVARGQREAQEAQAKAAAEGGK